MPCSVPWLFSRTEIVISASETSTSAPRTTRRLRTLRIREGDCGAAERWTEPASTAARAERVRGTSEGLTLAPDPEDQPCGHRAKPGGLPKGGVWRRREETHTLVA